MTSWQPPMIRVATHRFRTFCSQESSISPASQIIRPCVFTDSPKSVEQPCRPSYQRSQPRWHAIRPTDLPTYRPTEGVITVSPVKRFSFTSETPTVSPVKHRVLVLYSFSLMFL